MEVQKRLCYSDTALNHLHCHIQSALQFKFRVQLTGCRLGCAGGAGLACNHLKRKKNMLGSKWSAFKSKSKQKAPASSCNFMLLDVGKPEIKMFPDWQEDPGFIYCLSVFLVPVSFLFLCVFSFWQLRNPPPRPLWSSSGLAWNFWVTPERLLRRPQSLACSFPQVHHANSTQQTLKPEPWRC